MKCDPSTLACQIELLRAALQPTAWSTFGVPLLSMLIPVLVAVAAGVVSVHISRRELAVQKLAETAKARKQAAAGLMAAVSDAVDSSLADRLANVTRTVVTVRTAANLFRMELQPEETAATQFLVHLSARLLSIGRELQAAHRRADEILMNEGDDAPNYVGNKSGVNLANAWQAEWSTISERITQLLASPSKDVEFEVALRNIWNAAKDESFASGKDPGDITDAMVVSAIAAVRKSRPDLSEAQRPTEALAWG